MSVEAHACHSQHWRARLQRTATRLLSMQTGIESPRQRYTWCPRAEETRFACRCCPSATAIIELLLSSEQYWTLRSPTHFTFNQGTQRHLLADSETFSSTALLLISAGLLLIVACQWLAKASSHLSFTSLFSPQIDFIQLPVQNEWLQCN